MADDINDISHTSTYARAEAAIRKDERSKCSPDILVAAATALLEQYDLGTGSCLGVMSDGKACFKGSFLEKLEALRASRAANDDPDDEVFQDVIHALGFPAAAPIQDERSRWSASAAQLNNDIGILLARDCAS